MTSTYPLDRTTSSSPGQPARSPSRGWAIAGLGAGLAGIGGIGTSMAVDAVYREDLAGKPEAMIAAIADQTPLILAFHTLTLISMVLITVFAAGLRRRLASQAPADSLLPTVSMLGLGLVAVASLLGSGLTTELVFGAQQDGLSAAETSVLVFMGHWIGTIPWLWVGAGIAGVAVAVAAIRHAAAARWIGWASALLGGLTLLFGLSPLQYMAGFVGPLWLTVVAAGFAFGDRRSA